jgi:hypothetical protein
MVDYRKNARSLTLRTGKVHALRAPNSIDCAVLNISQSGACILVPDGTEISESFVLEIDHDRQVRNCKVAWRDGCRIGLKFDDLE